MSQFRLISKGIDVAPLLAELDVHPELWNSHTNRTRHPESPHRETDDLWIRYRDPKELVGPQSFAEPFEFIAYPAWRTLRESLAPIVMDVWGGLGMPETGGILMTRIPPRGNVYSHHDRGTWHAEHFNTKVWLPLRANDQCFNRCEDETVVMKPGEAWTFDNLKMHSVQNMGATERIVLIMCFRTEPGQ